MRRLGRWLGIAELAAIAALTAAVLTLTAFAAYVRTGRPDGPRSTKKRSPDPTASVPGPGSPPDPPIHPHKP
jgi:hypothetical protein